MRHVVGPPGTGKTEALTAEVGRLIEAGADPVRMAVCTFTRAGADEAGSRMAERFGLNSDRLPWWRTLHGIGLRAIKESRDVSVAGPSHWRQFCRSYRLASAPDGFRPDGGEFDGQAEGDVLRCLYDWRRNNLLGFGEGYRAFASRFPDGLPVTMARASWFERSWSDFKREEALVDFGDMLTWPHESGWSPGVTHLIVDEAQDLSPIQVALVRRWSEGAETILGYDDDQTIYPYMGADPRWLLCGGAVWRELRESHRVPDRIWRVASRLIGRNRARRQKRWMPDGRQGGVYRDVPLDAVPDWITRLGGTWFVLARNRQHLRAVARVLNEASVPYANRSGWSPLDVARRQPEVAAALRLALGDAVTATELDSWISRRGGERLWLPEARQVVRIMARTAPDRLLLRQDVEAFATGAASSLLRSPGGALSLFGLERWIVRYLLDVLRRYGRDALLLPPAVEIGTIHAVKGAEADHVAVLPDMTRRTAYGYDTDPEPERRVWYVAATRARESLLVLERRGRGRYFDEL
jgi:superfamily I DNA/RNA helicase